MTETSKSCSTEQKEAEKYIFEIVQNQIGENLKANPKIFLADNAFTYIQPDFYSENGRIVGEIFANIGKPKKAQDNKIANDILKMLLLEKVTGKQYRKIIVVCDEAEEKKLLGLSALAESIRQFEIEVIKIEISEDVRSTIIVAQDRQIMKNA
jgi:hypothetical protein